MTTATARREAARGNGVASAGQFGHQTHSAPGTFLPVDRVKVLAEQVDQYNSAKTHLVGTGQVYAAEQLRALFPTAVRAEVTFADRIGRFDELVEEPDAVRATEYDIFDKDGVDLVEKLDSDIEQIMDTAFDAGRKLTTAEQKKVDKLEADRVRIREQTEIALASLAYEVLDKDFNRESRVQIPTTAVPVDEAQAMHFAAMDQARAAAHATIDAYRRDLADYAASCRLDQIAHVEIHTRDADAFDEELENTVVNRIFDRDGDVIYDYATGTEHDDVYEFMEYADQGLHDLNEQTNDANLRLMAKLARDAVIYGIDPQYTSKGLPAATGTFGKLPMGSADADPTSVALFDV